MKEFIIAAVFVGLVVAWFVHKDLCTWDRYNPLWQLIHCPTIYRAKAGTDECSAMMAAIKEHNKYHLIPGGSAEERDYASRC
jgi:hypothetical protein